MLGEGCAIALFTYVNLENGREITGYNCGLK